MREFGASYTSQTYTPTRPPSLTPPSSSFSLSLSLPLPLPLPLSQAVDQLVQCLTDDKYKGNMVVVVAGYENDIDQLMNANPGLASRFPETLHFPDFDVDDCCRLLESGLKRAFSTDLSPDAAAALPGLLLPVLQV